MLKKQVRIQLFLKSGYVRNVAQILWQCIPELGPCNAERSAACHGRSCEWHTQHVVLSGAHASRWGIWHNYFLQVCWRAVLLVTSEAPLGRRDVVIFSASANKARSNVLDALEFLDLQLRVSAE